MTVLLRSRFRACQSGVTAVEFALILPPLIMLLIGLTSASLVLYSNSSLQFAVEKAARCYSVDAVQCANDSATQTYAKSAYSGLETPTFTASNAACGRQVNATVTVSLNAALVSWDIPLAATACFP